MSDAEHIRGRFQLDEDLKAINERAKHLYKGKFRPPDIAWCKNVRFKGRSTYFPHVESTIS
jgi:hypothetical protein